jgi:cyclopropane fatty-acyl-phospholipid synthase-like methyltransferase
MLDLAQVYSNDIVYDLGCGDGRVLQIAVKEYGAKKAVGYELRTDIYKSALKKIRNKIYKIGLKSSITTFSKQRYLKPQS